MPTILRFRGRRVWRAALFLVGLASLAWGQGSGFVQSSNGMLTLGGLPFRFGGTNSYPLMYSNQSTVKQILTTTANSNLKVVRMWVFCDSTCGNGFFFQFFNTGAGAPVYNDSAINGLDNVDLAVNEANALGIKLIMTLTNNWTDFGGMDTYVKWRGLQNHDDFYTDPTIFQWYESWVSHVLTHKNTVQGPSYNVAYKDDPTIMAWELANEPECGGSGPPNGYGTSGNCNTQTIVTWITNASAYVKSIDSNHLVAVGDEGYFCSPSCASNGVDSYNFSNVKQIDLVGLHLYPDSWGESIAWTEDYINQHLQEAQELGKPLYMGEFGLMSGNAKEFIYNDWTNRIFSGGGSGAMFWDVLPGTPTPANAEAASTFDEEAGSPVLWLMDDFAQLMAGSTQQLPPVAGYQWATTTVGQPATLNVLSNDVAYGGATIDPTTINLGTNPQDQQASLTVTGGVFNVVGQTIQFTPQAGYVGIPFGSYTVKDSNQQVSNVGYLFVTVNPALTGWAILDSFESGTDGWGANVSSGAAGTVALSPTFHSDGSFSLQVNVAAGGWFGVTFPNPVNLSNWPSLAVDVGTTSVGTYSAFAFQSGSSNLWCQNSGPTWQPLNLFSTTTLTVQLEPSALVCYPGSGATATTPDLSSVSTLYVYFGNPGTYYLDNLRAGPASGTALSLPVIAGIGNAGGGQPGVSAGTYFSIYGSNLAPASTAVNWNSSIGVNGQLPTKLAGVSVTVGGLPGYPSYVSPGQINVLAPNLGPGPTAVTVTTSAGTSEPYIMTAPSVQPAFFQWAGNYAIATDLNYDPLVKNGAIPGQTTAPAQPGEGIYLWGTGFGPTTPAAPAGQIIPASSTQYYSVNGVTATIGGLPATVQWTLLSPGSAGLYQLYVTVPTLANGDYPIVATVDGVSSPQGVNLTVQQ
ncbi:MAG: cellulase family glycosylhydrolase [Bryobacteraceae bacterium]